MLNDQEVCMRHLKTITTCLNKLEGRRVELVELGEVITIVDQKTSLPITMKQFIDLDTAKEFVTQRGYVLC